MSSSFAHLSLEKRPTSTKVGIYSRFHLFCVRTSQQSVRFHLKRKVHPKCVAVSFGTVFMCCEVLVSYVFLFYITTRYISGETSFAIQ